MPSTVRRGSRGAAPAPRSRPTRRPGRSRAPILGRRAIGVLAAVVGLSLVGAAAITWVRVVAHRDAVDAALEDIADPADGAVLTAGAAPPAGAEQVTVSGVADGGTLVVAGAGSLVPGAGVSLRLLLVDAPVLTGTDDAPQCMAASARDFLAGLVPVGTTLSVVADGATTDSQGRTLAYAWLPDGTFLNETVVRNGYGYAVVAPPADEHIGLLITAEDAARSERRGVWGAC